MPENAGVYTALKSAVKVDTRVSIFYLRSLLVADLSTPAWLPTVGGRGPCLPGRRLSRYVGKFAVFIKSMFQWLKAHWDNRPLALRGHVTNASFNHLSWNLADAKNC